MPKVFISYAHSSNEHKQRVAGLANALTGANVSVLVDTDVQSPVGPPEGWPKWMAKHIKDADYVLVYFDDTYRRRFDGEEEFGKGLGATWEGCIITHDLHQAAGRNVKFNPVLTDGSETELIPSVLLGANRYCIPSQQDELAKVIAEAHSNGTEATPQDAETGDNELDEWSD